jgi:hypothetical protein
MAVGSWSWKPSSKAKPVAFCSFSFLLVFIGIFGCAAGWHICFDVLDRFLVGKPIGAIAGVDAMKFAGWQRLVAEYSKQFGVEAPGWTPRGGSKVVN